MKVLIVDDDEISRGLLAAGISKLGYEPLEAEDGATALSVLNSGEPIELMILDIVLPDMSGDSLLEELRICLLYTSPSPRD